MQRSPRYWSARRGRRNIRRRFAQATSRFPESAGETCGLNSGNLNILSEARIHAPELISDQVSVDPIEEVLCSSLVSREVDASYHPMIVLSILFRRVMQYMIWGLHSWIS